MVFAERGTSFIADESSGPRLVWSLQIEEHPQELHFFWRAANAHDGCPHADSERVESGKVKDLLSLPGVGVGVG